MARPRRDGTLPRQPIKKKFTDTFIDSLKPDTRLLIAYDTHLRGLAVTVQPKSGAKTYKAIYYVAGFPRWYHIGNADTIGLADARKIAARIMLRAATGEDPVALRKAERSRGTFEELAWHIVDQYAKKKNKSWRQADKLVRRYLLPKWGKLQATAVSRADAKAMMASHHGPDPCQPSDGCRIGDLRVGHQRRNRNAQSMHSDREKRDQEPRESLGRQRNPGVLEGL